MHHTLDFLYEASHTMWADVPALSMYLMKRFEAKAHQDQIPLASSITKKFCVCGALFVAGKNCKVTTQRSIHPQKGEKLVIQGTGRIVKRPKQHIVYSCECGAQTMFPGSTREEIREMKKKVVEKVEKPKKKKKRDLSSLLAKKDTNQQLSFNDFLSQL